MKRTYAEMGHDAEACVAAMVKRYHPDLAEAGVTFDLLSVSVDDEDKHALIVRGFPADAVVCSTDVKARTKGAADVRIVFDEKRWLEMSQAERLALVDHELEHCELRLNAKTGKVKLDCHGRPLIKMRHHDAEIGLFASVAKRHGEASGEIQQCRALFKYEDQTFFPFAQIAPAQPKLEAAK